MSVVASFNYTHSVTAVVTGGVCAAVLVMALIRLGRPWIAAAAGAVGWAVIGFLVGIAGTGDMRGLTGVGYAITGAPAGALIAGGGALVRYLVKRPTPPGTRYSRP
jgi:predicted membrane protein